MFVPGWADFGSCPKGTELVQSIDPNHPWACVTLDAPHEAGISTTPCRHGTTRVATTNTFAPFRCALDDFEPDPPGSTNWSPKPSRDLLPGPGTTEPVAEPGKQPTARPKGEVKNENKKHLPSAPGPNDYFRFSAPGRMQVDFPKKWRMVDRWTASPATVSAQLDFPRDGRQVSIGVTYCADREKDCPEYETAVFTEKRSPRSRQERSPMVGGPSIKVFLIPAEARTAYVKVGDGYFVVAYRAPGDLFGRYETVFDRVLKSLRAE